MKFTLTLLLLLVFIFSFGQNQDTKRIRGIIINETSGLGIEGANIYTVDSSYKTTSNKLGAYSLKVSKRTGILIFSHAEYKRNIVSFKNSERVVDAELIRLIPNSVDLPENNFTLSILPLKFITGAISLRFEQFINVKMSAGTYLTYYFNGRQYFGSEKFKGLKASPYFRYYFKHNKSYGFYAQGSVIIAYFDFSKLNYNYSNKATKTISTYFWTGGLSAAIGITDIVKNSQGFIIDINIGMQMLPLPIETTITDEHGTEYDHNPAWWMLGGPGSFVEIKLAIGGIF